MTDVISGASKAHREHGELNGKRILCGEDK